MTQAKPGQVQIRLTLQDAEVLSSRVKTESIQYEFMINYIIAVTSHARRNNLMSLCSYQRSH